MKKLLIVALCISLVAVFFGCNLSITTANFQNIQTASQVDNTTKKPITVTSTFTSTSPFIYVTGSINNAPEGTTIKGEWIYNETDPVTIIDSATLKTVEVDTDFQFNLSKPTNDWPTGKYEVKLYIDDKYIQSVNFEVK